MVTQRRAFTLFRDGCVTLDIAASSTLTWRIPHQIPSTGELDIEPSQKLSAIALSDVQAERVAAKPISDASSANLTLPDYGRVARHPPRIARQALMELPVCANDP
jgi:hypothetical protein